MRTPETSTAVKLYKESDSSHFSENGTRRSWPMKNKKARNMAVPLPEILFITSYPPRECGIATYTQDLIRALTNKFKQSFKFSICALQNDAEQHEYTGKVHYTLNTDHKHSFYQLAEKINANAAIDLVVLQHEFGFFAKNEEGFVALIEAIHQPVVVVFHTILPDPNSALKANVQSIAAAAASVVVMTRSSAQTLHEEYDVDLEKISIISHGTHLLPHANKSELKAKYGLTGKHVLSTFGLLSAGKSIETTLKALPSIIFENPDVMFLIIGITHPSVVKNEGERYRQKLETLIKNLNLEQHTRFVNRFLPLPELLEYLQATDIYLFTSNDPEQAVSGTFSYAISSGCPIVSTPIPHAQEVLGDDVGIIFDFDDSQQLARAVNQLLSNSELTDSMSSNGRHRMASTAWQNSAIAHARLFKDLLPDGKPLQYSLPVINLDHMKRLTTDFGMIQFSVIDRPDITSGYTLDDNARALIATCKHFETSGNQTDVAYIQTYFNFIQYCLQPSGYFLNYVNEAEEFTDQNATTNLEDANGRAIWALGYLVSMSHLLPKKLAKAADKLLQRGLQNVSGMHSSRAMAFVMKGLYYRTMAGNDASYRPLMRKLADRLVQMYRHEETEEWHWFEAYLTYANSVLPEAMLCAWMVTGDFLYRDIAQRSFDFLLSKTFNGTNMQVISNKTWLYKEESYLPIIKGGEQPIDVAYTVLALDAFYKAFHDEKYLEKEVSAFNWFLGKNHLHQIIYNPGTGGCYDGLEETHVNLNQGAESTVSYLMARLSVGDNKRSKRAGRSATAALARKAKHTGLVNIMI